MLGGGSVVIDHFAFDVEPWCLRERELDFDVLAQTESVFALANGHIGWRGNLDEGDPHGLSGSYLSGVFERRPLPYAEVGYGYPESDEVVVNVTDGKVVRLLVDDQPLDVRYGRLTRHERRLDFRTGLLHRELEWTSPSGRTVRVTTTRLVSLTQRAIAAIHYEVEAIDGPVNIVIQSELVANEPPPPASGDPRVAAALDAPWNGLLSEHGETSAVLVHRTQRSLLSVAAAMDHVVSGGHTPYVTAESSVDLGRVTVATALEPGERITLVKYVAYGWSSARTPEALRDQVDAALVSARVVGWEGLVEEQREYLDDYWDRADVEIEGDDEIQQAVRFALFHVLQAGARNEGRAIAAKGLTGNGYDGHAFWDSETFVLPVYCYTSPDAAADALTWRHSTLDLARLRAGILSLGGAAFAWRTISGPECSSYWPAGTAAFHVSADVADAVVRYVHATGDEEFERGVGLELLVETARMWRTLGHEDARGDFRIDGVTGPDEYSALADNNVYTNLMAQRNLRAAIAAAERYPVRASEIGVSSSEREQWRRAAAAMFIPFDEDRGIHPQSEGYTDHEVWDFGATTPEQYPLLLNFHYVDLYRKQVVKQADLVLALYLRGDAFTAEQKRDNFKYYEALTVRDSSLSACTQAVVAAEVGYLDLAYDYVWEAALMDLDDLEHNTRDGLHVASLAGTWISLVAGLGGLRESGETISVAPRLPHGVKRLTFRLLFRGRRLLVEATPRATRLTLRSGEAIEVVCYGTSYALEPGATVAVRTPRRDHRVGVEPSQPSGRRPRRRAGE